MYVIYNETTKRVFSQPIPKKPLAVANGLKVAEVDTIPSKYDYLTITNEQVKTRVVKEAYIEKVIEIEYDDNGKEVEKEIGVTHEAVIENYNFCELLPNFKPQPTEEEIAKIKYKKYEDRAEQLIREKYSVSQELAILRQRDKKVEEFNNYDVYAEECKAQAHKEVYGNHIETK